MTDNFTFLDSGEVSRNARSIDVGGVHYPVSVLANESGTIVDAGSELGIATTGATDDAAAAGAIFPIAGVYQSTVDTVDAGDVGRVRMSARRAMVEAADFRVLTLTSALPVPTGSDITNVSGGALISADFTIADAILHYYVVPMSGWRTLNFVILRSTAFSGGSWTKMTVTISGHYSSIGGIAAQLAQFEWLNPEYVAVGSGGSVGQGGLAGGASASVSRNYYSVPAMSDAWPFVSLSIIANSAPTDGALSLAISRRA